MWHLTRRGPTAATHFVVERFVSSVVGLVISPNGKKRKILYVRDSSFLMRLAAVHVRGGREKSVSFRVTFFGRVPADKRESLACPFVSISTEHTTRRDCFFICRDMRVYINEDGPLRLFPCPCRLLSCEGTTPGHSSGCMRHLILPQRPIRSSLRPFPTVVTDRPPSW